MKVKENEDKQRQYCSLCRLVADLSDNVKLKRSNEENNSIYFSNYFPNLFIVLCDFFLELKINGREVLVIDYKHPSKTLIQANSIKASTDNAIQQCHYCTRQSMHHQERIN